jgi:hypothetical protein
MSDSLLRKYTERQSEDRSDHTELEAEILDDLGVFGWLRGTRDKAIMLELRKKDGNVLAVGYAWLERAEFDPSLGITLHVVGKTIRIKGRNLNSELRPNVRLFQGITRHRVPWIQEADGPTTMESQGKGTLVEKIEW